MKKGSIFFFGFLLFVQFLFIGSAWVQTNPTPFDLSTGNFSFSSQTATNTTYPANIQGWATSGNNISTAETTIPSADQALVASGTSSTSGLSNLGTNGFQFLSTSSSPNRKVGSICIAINTNGRQNIQVSWTAQDMTSSTTGTTMGLSLQYRIGVSGAFIDMGSSNQYQTLAASQNTTQNFSNIQLPSICENNSIVQLRWIYYQIGTTGTSRDAIRLDDIIVSSTSMPACSGTPAPGNTLATVNPVGSGSSTVLSLQNATTGTGVTYQWKSSTDNVTFTNISGATNATYTATPTVATYYACDVTCSGVTTTSNPLQVTLTYCTPISSSSSTYFSGFTTSGGVTNISNNSTTFATGGYVNYSSSMAVSQFATATVNFSATIVGGTAGIAIFVDYNNDFDFIDAGETVYNSAAYQSTGTTSSSFVIPAGTALGNYRMRIVTDYNIGSPTSCAFASGSRGEVEDYTLTVVAQPTCMVPTALTSSSISYQTATIGWTAPSSGTAPAGYDYEVRTSGAAGSGATGLVVSGSTSAPTVSAAITGLTGATAYSYYVRSNCGSGDFSAWTSAGTFTSTSCNVPTGLTSSSITASSATITWVAPSTGSPAGYEYEVRTSGAAGSGATGLVSTGTTTAPTVTANLTGLSASSTYSVYVRSNCYTGYNSSWTSASSFNTLCIAETAPTSIQTFATYTGSAPSPICWSEATSSSVTTSTTLTVANSEWLNSSGFANTGSNVGVKTNLYGTDSDDWLISNQIDLGNTAGVYRLKYDMAVTSYNGTVSQSTIGTHIVRVIISTDGGTSWSSTNTLKTYTGTGMYSNTGVTEYINLSNYSGIIKIAFVATTSSTSPDIDFHLDNFAVETIPPPSITSFTPSQACVSGGQNLTITGTNFNTITSVLFAGSSGAATLNGTIVSQTATTVSVVVPPNFVDGTIKIVNAIGNGVSATNLVALALPTASVSSSAICSGNNAVFAITGTANAVVTYNLNSGSNTTVTLDGSGNGSVTVTAPSTNQTINLVSVNLASTGCTKTLGTSATISLNAVTSITTQPSNQSAQIGSNAQFNVVAAGTNITYQWQEDTGGGIFTNINGQNSSTLTINNVSNTDNGRIFHCEIAGVCGTVTTNDVVLTASSIGITTQPADATICNSGSTTLSLVTSGTITNYQWQISTDNQTTWTDISGETNATLALSGLSYSSPAKVYRCNLNNGTLYTNGATVTVYDQIAITSQPTSQTICTGTSSVSFSVTASGSNPTYQWQVSTNSGSNWANVASGGTGATYTLSNPADALNGSQYRVIVTGSSPCTAVTSNAVTLNVIYASIASSVSSGCINSAFTLTATLNGNPTNPTYSWACPTTGSGATTAITSNPASITPTATGTFIYTLTAGSTECPTVTKTINYVVNALPTISSATATPSSVCSGTTITLTGVNSTIANYVSSRTAPTNIANTTPSTYGLVFDVTTAFTLNSVDVFNGTTSSGTFIIQLQNSAGTVLQTSSTFTAPAGTGVIGSTVAYTANLGWSIPIGTSYRLLVTSGTASLIRESSLGGFPYTIGSVGSITSGYIGGTSSTYYYLYNWKVSTVSDQSNLYSWSWNSTPVIATNIGTISEINTGATATTKTYTVTATNATTGCVNTATTSAITINPATITPTATNSSQCGTATPACSVSGTGTSGNTFKWYTVATGGTALTGQTASTLTSYPISATTSFYVSEFNGTCESPRVQVTASVTAAPTITATASVNPVCSGSATSLTATSANSGYSYSWSNSAGTGATVSVNPTSATTYTVTGTDNSGGANNGCVTTATIAVTTNALPTAITLTPTTSTNLCMGDVKTIVASGGNGATTNPVSIFNENFEISAGSFTAQNASTAVLNNTYYSQGSSSVLFNTAASTATKKLTLNSNIDLTNCASATLTFSHIAAMEGSSTTYDYGFVEYSIDGGTNWVVFPASSYVGTASNTVFSGTDVRFSTKSYTDWTSSLTSATSTPTNLLWKTEQFNVPSGALTNQFKIRFSYYVDGSTFYYGWLIDNVIVNKNLNSIVWSPSTALYTDVAATTAYTGNPTTVYAKPTSTTTYTATATTAAGCTSSASVTVNVAAPSTQTVANNDFVWRGTTNTAWSTASNWVKFDGTTYSVASTSPVATDNVFIPQNITCVANQPSIGAGTVAAKAVYIEPSATVTGGSGSLDVKGDFTNNGTFTAGTGTVSFSGTTAQQITGATTFYNLTENNSAGLTLNSPVMVSNGLTMTAGNITTSSTNLLTLGNSAPATLAWTSGKVVGPMKRWMAAATNSGASSSLFPLGNGSRKAQASIEYTTAPTTAGYLEAKFIATSPANAATNAYATLTDQFNYVLDNVVTEGYWEIKPSATTGVDGGAYSVTLEGDNISLATSTNASYTDVRVIKSPDPHTSWILQGDHGTATGANADFTVSRTGMSGYSFFAMAFPSAAPLPVELVSFAANCEDNNTIAVNWTTASEHNSDHYTVEKSRDGSSWKVLKTIPAAGNSTQLLNYSIADASDISGTVYYRLTQVDVDGASKVYDIVSTNCSSEKELTLLAYPNPSNGQFSLKILNALGGKYELAITDMQGKSIDQQSIDLESGTTVVKLNPANVQPSVYLLQFMQNGNVLQQQKLVIE